MKVFFKRFVCQFLALSLICLPFTVRAGMIGTDEVIAQAQTQSDRATVRDFLARADVQKQLQDHGLTQQAAQERVNALTDVEIQQIAGRINEIPAGAIHAEGVVAIVLIWILIVYLLVQHFYPSKYYSYRRHYACHKSPLFSGLFVLDGQLFCGLFHFQYFDVERVRRTGTAERCAQTGNAA